MRRILLYTFKKVFRLLGNRRSYFQFNSVLAFAWYHNIRGNDYFDTKLGPAAVQLSVVKVFTKLTYTKNQVVCFPGGIVQGNTLVKKILRNLLSK